MGALTAPTSMALLAPVEEPSTASEADCSLRSTIQLSHRLPEITTLIRVLRVLNEQLASGLKVLFLSLNTAISFSNFDMSIGSIFTFKFWLRSAISWGDESTARNSPLATRVFLRVRPETLSMIA
jgi:hypothetical protein